MVYSAEEKEKMDALVAAFGPHIRQHRYFDLVYSEKLGYLRLVFQEASDDTVLRIGSFDELLKTLIDDMVADEEEACDGKADLCKIRTALLEGFPGWAPGRANAGSLWMITCAYDVFLQSENESKSLPRFRGRLLVYGKEILMLLLQDRYRS